MRLSQHQVLAASCVVSISALATPLAAQDDDDNWSEGFVLPGLQGSVLAATSYAGDLVIGGDFAILTDRQVNYIVRWDGSVWLTCSP